MYLESQFKEFYDGSFCKVKKITSQHTLYVNLDFHELQLCLKHLSLFISIERLYETASWRTSFLRLVIHLF